MNIMAHPKVPVIEVCASLASCRSPQMIEVMLNFALEDTRYSHEELAQMNEVWALQKAGLE